MDRALSATAGLWPPVGVAFAWVLRAAAVLGAEGITGAEASAGLDGLLAEMGRDRGAAGGLSGAIDHFLKVTRSCRPGLFACYDTPGLPRTNNGLEQAFGSHRHHERRATGRKGASPALVLRGPVRLVAGLATRSREVTAADLAEADLGQWREVRSGLEERRQRRAERHRFRRDPDGYLKELEIKLNQSRLPA